MSRKKFKYQYNSEENFELSIERLIEQIKHFQDTNSQFSFTRLMFRFESAEYWAKQCGDTQAKLNTINEYYSWAHDVMLECMQYYTVNAYNENGRCATQDIRIMALDASHACYRYWVDNFPNSKDYSGVWAITAFNTKDWNNSKVRIHTV